jgi:hypothetical protein
MMKKSVQKEYPPFILYDDERRDEQFFAVVLRFFIHQFKFLIYLCPAFFKTP